MIQRKVTDAAFEQLLQDADARGEGPFVEADDFNKYAVIGGVEYVAPLAVLA